MFDLAPTKITFSSYNWVEAPNSTCTGSNLYREDNMLFLALLYHPFFSDLNVFSIICIKTDITMHTKSVLICFWIFFCTLVLLIVSILDILESTRSPLSFCNPHFDSNPSTSSMSTENAHSLYHTHPFIHICP